MANRPTFFRNGQSVIAPKVSKQGSFIVLSNGLIAKPNRDHSYLSRAGN